MGAQQSTSESCSKGNISDNQRPHQECQKRPADKNPVPMPLPGEAPHEPAAPSPSPPSDQPLVVLTHDWCKPYTEYSINHDPPEVEYYKYEISTFHCPVRHQSLDKASETPWFAEFTLCIDDLGLLSRGPVGETSFPWRANLGKAFEDRIVVDHDSKSHWAIPGRILYKRDITLRCFTTTMIQEEEETDSQQEDAGHPAVSSAEWTWAVNILIWSECGDWLADELTYPKLKRLLNKETTVRTWATLRENVRDPLGEKKMFFDKYHGINKMEEEGGDMEKMEASVVESSLAVHLDMLKPGLEVDEPELRNIVEEHFGRHIYQ